MSATDLESVRVGLHRLQRLLATRRTWVALADAAGIDLGQQEIQVLEVLHDGRARSIAELSRMARMDAAAVSRQVRTLEVRGLVQRRPSSAHGRVSLVEASADGLSSAARLHDLRRRHLADALAEWEAGELETLGALLLRLVEDLQRTPYGAGVAR